MKKFMIMIMFLLLCSVVSATAFTAAGNGNWSSNATWGTAAGSVEGVNYPGNGDTVALGGREVTLDIPVAPATGTLGAMSAAGSGHLLIPIDSGSFQLKATTITCGTSTDGMLYITGAGGTNTVTITCTSITGGSGAGGYGLQFDGTGTINITGNIVGGSAAGAYSLYNSSAGTINITGSVTGGSAATAYGVHNGAGGTVNITGNVSGGTVSDTAYGIFQETVLFAPTCNVYGNITGSGVAHAIAMTGGNITVGTESVSRSITGGSAAGVYGLYNTGSGTITLYSTAKGGSNATAFGVFATAGTLNFYGNMDNSGSCMAWGGKPPTWLNASKSNYVKFGSTRYYPNYKVFRKREFN